MVTTYACELIRFQSLTPDKAGIHQWIKDKLAPLGFDFHEMTHPSGILNLIAWNDGILYGRGGGVDMKGGLAAMMAALQRLLQNHVQLNRQMVIAITSDEEDEAEYGTRLIVDWLKQHDKLPKYCLISEPTSTLQTGDEIKVGRRGP